MIRATILMISLALCSGAVHADEIPHTISVDGKGVVGVLPDMARVSIAVEERDRSLNVAQKTVADATEKVLELVDDLDIEDRHVDTTRASIQPDYRWNRETEEQELLGYIVRRQIDVEVRDLELLGALIEGAVRAGVNRVSPPLLESSRHRDAYREALAKAVQDARQNATAIADSLGVDLGDVVQVNATPLVPIPRPLTRVGMAQMGVAEADSGAASYQPGEMRLEATVGVVFRIED